MMSSSGTCSPPIKPPTAELGADCFERRSDVKARKRYLVRELERLRDKRHVSLRPEAFGLSAFRPSGAPPRTPTDAPPPCREHRVSSQRPI